MQNVWRLQRKVAIPFYSLGRSLCSGSYALGKPSLWKREGKREKERGTCLVSWFSSESGNSLLPRKPTDLSRDVFYRSLPTVKGILTSKTACMMVLGVNLTTFRRPRKTTANDAMGCWSVVMEQRSLSTLRFKEEKVTRVENCWSSGTDIIIYRGEKSSRIT